VRKASPTVILAATADGGKAPPLLILKRKTLFTQIRGISKGRYSHSPGKRMDDGGADVGMAENSMG